MGRLDKQRTTFDTLSKIWGQIRGAVMGRLDVLEQATATLLEGSLREELRQEAASEAHKLGGGCWVLSATPKAPDWPKQWSGCLSLGRHWAEPKS